MSLISFLKEAGEKLFGGKEAAAAPSSGAAAQPNVEELNAKAGAAITEYIRSQGLDAKGLAVRYDGASQTVTVEGEAPDQATREKIVLCCGNVQSVAQVDDKMTVTQPADESRWHTVEKGDTLSKIAKQFYGDANKYPQIFEANKPMLKHPDKIYPGQVLRIP
jgi:nucleoid-associated protein YgaU